MSIRVKDLIKSYPDPEKGRRRVVIDVPSFEMKMGDHLALTGQSGGGKTTFLHCLSGIIAADYGIIEINGKDIGPLSESKKDRFRADHIGYVYQTFNLIQGFSALENVILAMMFSKQGVNKEKAEALLVQMGLKDRLHYKPSQLSVGQQQRVCIARAVINNPLLILADEPTGNLDEANSKEALALLREVAKDKMLLLVTHEQEVVKTFDKVIQMTDINVA
jgi:putative ABC transport system ATP-binding protein